MTKIGRVMPYGTTSPWERRFLWLAYFIYFLAGLIFVFLPGGSMYQVAASPFLVLWHAFLIFGGIISSEGVRRRNAIIERMGIPLVFTALLAYGAILIVLALDQTNSPNQGPRLGVGLIMLSSTTMLLWRWAVIRDRLRIERRSQKRESL